MYAESYRRFNAALPRAGPVLLAFWGELAGRIWSAQFYYTKPGKEAYDGIYGVEFVPAFAEVEGGRVLVVIVVVGFAKHEDIDGEQVMGMVHAVHDGIGARAHIRGALVA